MRRKVILGLTTILTIIFVGAFVSFILPVEFDSGACGGGFKSYVAQLYIDEFENRVIEKYGEKYSLMSDSSEIARTIDWDGRDISCEAVFTIDGKKYDWYCCHSIQREKILV